MADGPRQMFTNGGLNPHLVQLGLRFPEFLQFTLKCDTREYADAKLAMCRELEKIKQARPTATTIVLSVPHAAYTSNLALGGLREIGFQIGDEALTSSSPDSTTKSAAEWAGVECVAVGDKLRRSAHADEAFFRYDGHFTRTGHRLFAEAVFPEIKQGKESHAQLDASPSHSVSQRLSD